MNTNNKKKGFTLVELLIVIGILAVLGTTAVVILNPAQLLAQARDGQRISDLGSISGAIGLYMSDVSPVNLGLCNDGVGVIGRHITGSTPDNGSFATVGTTGTGDRTVGNGAGASTGWVDIDFAGISGGAPFGALPIDPTNSDDFIYRYACEDASSTSGALSPAFELNACLESEKHMTQMDNDGGDKNGSGTTACGTTRYYEVGTKLTL